MPRYQNGDDYYYEKTILGDITAVYSADGTKVAAYTYDAWGNHAITLDVDGIGTLNPIRYRGYYYDTETGLYYMSSRYYDPVVCRWINADDTAFLGADGTPLSYNLYAYCFN